MSEINQNRVNYTNLANTYMYSKMTDRINFYQYYKNDKNSLDDPIFTGFTFDIDTLHSPLFYTGDGDMYLNYETLSSPYVDNSSLAETIEKRLSYVYKTSILGSSNGYEINTLSTKDFINLLSGHTAGYGLQDKVYMDNVAYGATDYIYMVDKVSDSKFSDDMGVSDLGDGTPNSTVYNDYNANVKIAYDERDPFDEYGDVLMMDDMAAGNIINHETSSLGNAIKQREKELENDEIKAEHNDNKAKLDKAKEDVDKAKMVVIYKKYQSQFSNNYQTFNPDPSQFSETISYDELKSRCEELENAIDEQLRGIKIELENYKKQSDSILTQLKSNPKSDANVAKCKEDISNLGEEFSNFVHSVNNNENSKYKDINCNIVYTTDVEDNTYLNHPTTLWFKDMGLQTWFGVTQMGFSTFVFIDNAYIKSCTASKESSDQLANYKKLLKNTEGSLYGFDEKGNPFTQYNPAPGSIYGNMLEAQNNYNHDKYSIIKEQINSLGETRDHYDDLAEYNNYAESKNETRILKQMPTMDPPRSGETQDDYKKRVSAYEVEIEKIKNTRATYDAPQTVYDMLGFISGMKKLTRNYPYILKSVSGLEEAYKNYFSMKDPYMGSGDEKITISCFESLDLRVSSMFNKYLNAVYDRQYKRERVPINMRRFNCSLYVHDIRNFRHALSKMNPSFYEKKDGDDAVSKMAELALNYMSVIEFRFYDCEIVPEETGNIFGEVSNEDAGDMRSTDFTFTYGNCVVNFLPFEDLNRYFESNRGRDKIDPIQPLNDSLVTGKAMQQYEYDPITKQYKTTSPVQAKNIQRTYTTNDLGMVDNDSHIINQNPMNAPDSGDRRRWFDESVLGNVNNNDYRDYVRKTSTVAVDDHYKSVLVDSFAMNSVANKNREVNDMDDALRRIVTGIAASTGMSVLGVTDALNIGFIDPIINERDKAVPIVKHLGNVTNRKDVTTENAEYIGKVEGFDEPELDILKDLGNINTK